MMINKRIVFTRMRPVVKLNYSDQMEYPLYLCTSESLGSSDDMYEVGTCMVVEHKVEEEEIDWFGAKQYKHTISVEITSIDIDEVKGFADRVLLSNGSIVGFVIGV